MEDKSINNIIENIDIVLTELLTSIEMVCEFVEECILNVNEVLEDIDENSTMMDIQNIIARAMAKVFSDKAMSSQVPLVIDLDEDMYGSDN